MADYQGREAGPDPIPGQLALWPPDEMPADQLDINTIELMHKGDPHGHVVFARRVEEGIKHVASIQVNDLRGLLPGFVEYLLDDSYMSVNTFKGPSGGSFRRTDMLRKLHACYVDLDFYKLDPPLTFEKARFILFGMVMSGWLPEPSIIASSGRGMYAFWLFAEPPEATRETHQLYREAQKQLNEICRRLGADPRARDAARVLRTPGSHHTGAGKRVQYVVQADQEGELFAYLLPTLAERVSSSYGEVKRLWQAEETPLLPSRLPATLPAVKPTKAGEPLPEGSLMPTGLPIPRTRVQTRAYKLLQELTRLVEQRGGIPRETYRHCFLWRCAGCLNALGYRDNALFAVVNDINLRACRPAQKPHEVFAACSNPLLFMRDEKTGAIRFVTNDELTADMGATVEEAREQAFNILVPPQERERRQQIRKAKAESRQAATDERRRWLRECIDQADLTKPFRSYRDLAKEFSDQFDDVSYETIRNDLAALGYHRSKATGLLQPR